MVDCPDFAVRGHFSGLTGVTVKSSEITQSSDKTPQNLSVYEMSEIPKFSIITVCYNSSQTISKNLKSVASQSFDNYEHIIIDGGSNDNTLEIVSAFGSEKMKVISEPDNGIYDAMNKGLGLASGQFVAILNSDDFFATDNVLQAVYEHFQKYKCDVVFSSICFVNSRDEVIGKWIPKDHTMGSYLKGFHVPHPGFFAVRKLYERLGFFDLSMKIAADFDLMYRFMEHSDTKCSRLDIATVMMRADGESSSFNNIIRGYRDILRSFDKNGKSVFPPSYILRRYLPKIKRKFSTIISINRKI